MTPTLTFQGRVFFSVRHMAHSIAKVKLPVLVGGRLWGNTGPQLFATCCTVRSQTLAPNPGINLGDHLSLKEPLDEPLDTHLSSKP